MVIIQWPPLYGIYEEYCFGYTYDFVGNVLATKETHIDPQGVSTALLTTNTYDSRGRIESCVRELDGMVQKPVYYSYDALGRLSQKIIGDGPDNVGYIAFDYDIHGWATGISARNNFGQDLVFGETLRYASPQKPGSTARFDGSISEITFTAFNGTATPSAGTYGYAYDGLKRLTDAAYYSGTASVQSLLKTEKNITYDRNGNITGLDRYGASGLSDMLSFAHSGNRLSSVQAWDGENLPQTGTFSFDALGNMTSDSSKGLQFCYNFANLPSKVEGGAGGANAGLTLSYGYLSDGTKTSAVIGTGNSAEGLKYRGSFVYELKDGAERLSSIGWSDGRLEYLYALVLVEDGDEVIEDSEELLGIDDLWYIPDHLGNVRAVVDLTDGGTVVESNGYLPFGTRLANATLELGSNRYRLGGKEEQRFGTLNIALSDFGARYYDPFTARWTTRDPLAGKYAGLSPYNYCAGNPVMYYDPNGKDRHISTKNSTKVISATFYVDYGKYNGVSTFDSFKKAINVLNETTGLSYDDNGKTYSVVFKLDVQRSYNPQKASNNKVGANHVVIENTLGYRKDSNGNDILGEANGGKKVTIHAKSLNNTGVVTHEILHSLGAATKRGPNGEDPHHKTGYMTSSTQQQTNEVTKQTIDEIIENGHENTF